MTRMSSLLVASTLAILPISAFAQTNTAPAKATEPTSMTTATTAPVTGKTGVTMTTAKPEAKAITAPAAKSDVKTPVAGVKTDVNGINTSATHSKTTTPAKPAEPAKS